MSKPKQTGLKVIVGLGKTGLSCANYFARNGIQFAVTDTRENPPCLSEFKAQFPKVELALGGFSEDLLAKANEIILSPGISPHEPVIQAYSAKNIPIIGDIELFARAAKAPICAITGSNGKSTVTSLVAEMARYANLNVRVGGNLGTPALDLIKTMEPDLYILELSSFQLETTYSLSPTAGSILNITPDHMDRYSSLEDYVAAKHRIYHGCEYIIWNRDDPLSKPEPKYQGINNISFGLSDPRGNEFGLLATDAGSYLAFGEDRLLCVNELALKGSHNWSNALAALGLGYAMGLSMPPMLQALQTFKGLPHRGELVAAKNGISWYNDSKGTNVGASVAALKGLAASILGKIVLIAGGQGKGADFSELRKPVADSVRAVILIGEDAPLIERAIKGSERIIVHANNMQEAVQLAAKQAEHGDAVLLSPACASFDMFKNFEHRGEVYTAAVKELVG